MKLLLLFLATLNFLHATTEILQNDCIKISVSEDGTLGDSNIPPGIQFDQTCKGNFSNDVDYLIPEIPYEYYSLKHNNNIYYANNTHYNHINNGDPDRKVIQNFEDFEISKNNQEIITTTFSKDKKFKIEHHYNLKEKEIKVVTSITNRTENILQNIYFARGLDPDVDYGRFKNMETVNTRGFNNNDEKDFVYTESRQTSSPIGLYSNSETPHNTSAFKFGDEEYMWMDAQVFYEGVYSGIGSMDSIINIAFNIRQLQPNETKKIEYSYICSGDIEKVIKLKSIIDIDGDKNIFSIPYSKKINYEKTQSIPSFRVESKNIPSVQFPLTIENIPKGIQVKINNNRFDTNNNSATIELSCNETYNVEVYRNKDFMEEEPFSIILNAGKVSDNTVQWLDHKFSLKFKPEIPTSAINVDDTIIEIPYKSIDHYEKVATALFTLENEYKKKTTDNNISLKLDNIPDGIKLEIEDQTFTKESPKTDSILIDSFQDYIITIYRNKNFKEQNEFTINFHGESNDKLILTKKDFSFKFKPIARTLTLKTSNNKLSMPLNRLDQTIMFTVEENGRKVTREELQSINLTSDLKLDNYQIIQKEEAFVLNFIPTDSSCLPPDISIGENSVKFTITTPFPNESASKNITIEIQDISFWEKWGCLITLLISLLLLLILIYGYIKKKRFCKNSHFKIERDGKRPSHSYFKQKVPFITKLIPFVDEKVSIEGITFVASGGCGVIIPKSSQTKRLNIDGETLEEMAGKRDIRLVGGMEIFKTNKIMRFHS